MKQTKNFIEKAKIIHGDKYDYSLVDFENKYTKVKIICLKHSEFLQTPKNHLNGQGCPKCANNQKSNTQEFIEKAKEIHGKYDYSLVEYINATIKVKIVCLKHGEFFQTPNGHLSGRGCRKCKKINNTQEFIEKAKEIHLDKYDYSLVEFKTSKIKVKIVCLIHGVFEQIPNNHISGQGCQKCGREEAKPKISMTLMSNTQEFIEKAKEIHLDRYDYSLVNYNTSREKVIILCKIHGEFLQLPKVHIVGKGCPECGREKTNYQRYKDKKTILYYIFLPEYNLYKIGLTQSSVESRFKKEIQSGLKIETLETKEFQDGYEAYLLEQKILNSFRKYKYSGEKLLYAGNSELFAENILNSF